MEKEGRVCKDVTALSAWPIFWQMLSDLSAHGGVGVTWVIKPS